MLAPLLNTLIIVGMVAKEIWRPLSRHPGYKVSSLGRVMSFRRKSPNGRVMVGGLDRDGYHRVLLYDAAGRSVNRGVHQLVLEAFVGPRPQGAVTLHLNNVKDDNRVGNLKWGTISENTRSAFADGLLTSRRIPACKARAIIASMPDGYGPRQNHAVLLRELAARHGVSVETVRNYWYENSGWRRGRR